MKKLLVVLLALTFVVALATAAFAVATTSVDGKVEVTLKNSEQFGGSVDGKIVFDLAKDYGDGYKAGLKIKLNPAENASGVILVALEPLDAADDDNVVSGPLANPAPIDSDGDGIMEDYYYYKVSYEKDSTAAFDGGGWVEITKDWGVLTASTAIKGNAANDLGGKCDLTEAPGIKYVNTGLVEGLTLTAIINDKDNLYNYMLKGVYATDALTLGAGYQANTVVEGADASEADAYAAWAAYQINEAMKASFEYTGRPNIGEGVSAMLLKFGYNAAPLTIDFAYYTKNAGYYSTDLDEDILSIPNIITSTAAMEGGYVSLSATYQLSDPLSIYGGVDYAMIEGWEEDNMLIKVGVTDKFTEKITGDASYAMFGPISQIVVKVTDKLADGLEASLELKSTSVEGAAEAVNGYTAKITATL